MTPYSLEIPINNVSFGSVAVALTRELFRRSETPPIHPIGPVDLSAQVPDAEFNARLEGCILSAQQRHQRKNPTLRLWHIGSSLASQSDRGNHLLTFFELDQLTPTELNILRQQAKVYVTSKFSQMVMGQFGVQAEYLPLGFDSHNFHQLATRPKVDGATSFLLAGKAEKRKGTFQVLRAWARRYGNNAAYRLNCCIHNPFIPQDRFAAMVGEALEGKPYWNIIFHQWAPENAIYNQTLQSSEIAICMSGGEGRDLPCYHATALGAWPVAMRAHAYLDYLDDENAVLVNPNGKTPAADGIHFASTGPFNIGNTFSFADEDFIAGCEEAERRVKSLGVNVKGMELAKVGYGPAVDILLRDLKG